MRDTRACADWFGCENIPTEPPQTSACAGENTLMQSLHFDEVIEKIASADKRYHRDAYTFLREALEFTQKSFCKNREVQHVTGQELLNGIRDYALAQFGPMTLTVLEEWCIRTTEDFGVLVFNMVEHNLLAKTENDSRADFKEGYDFKDAFHKPFLPSTTRASGLKTVS